MKNGLFKRILVTILSAMLVVSTLPVTSFAAVAKNVSETESVYSQLDNEKIASEAYQAFLKAMRTGSDADIIAAYKLISKLTPTQRVHFFILKYKDIYKSLQKKGTYKFFDPEKYLLENPDVYALAKQKGVDPVTFALEHYLSDGIFEGRSSCTEFDPIVAIVAYPDATLESIVIEEKPTEAIITSLQNAFAEASGTRTTEGYTIGSLRPVLDDLTNIKPEDTYVLVVSKPGESVMTAVAENISGNGGNSDSVTPVEIPSGSNNPSGEGGNEDPTWHPGPTIRPTQQPTTSPTTPPTQSPTQSPTPVKTPEPHDGPFKQVIMVYMCGSDLENADNPAASKSIVEMLQSSFSHSGNTEVYILAGGASNWYNPVMQSDLGGDNLGKVALYKLDSKNYSPLPSELEPADIINSNNVIKMNDFRITEDGENNVSMGDPETLSGFVNYVTAKANADDYSLIVWNHGGGFSETICADVNHNEGGVPDGLYGNELVDAFDNMDYLSDTENKFSVLGFDACLMGQYEIAYTLSPYYWNMIGTSQLETGDFDYRATIARMDAYAGDLYSSRDDFLADLLSTVAGSNHADAQGLYMPYTCFDSYEFSKQDDNGNTINACLEDMGAKMTAMLQYNEAGGSNTDSNRQAVELYQAIRKARALTTVYGNTYAPEMYDYLDMGELFYNMHDMIGELVVKYPDNDEYKDIFASVEAVINHLNSDEFVYLSSAYRDGGNLYQSVAVNHESYETYPEVYRYSEFYRALGLSDKMLGVSIFAPIRTSITEDTLNNRYIALGMEEYGKYLEAYDNMARSSIYTGTDAGGAPITYNEAQRIAKLTQSGVKFEDFADISHTAIKTINTGRKDTKYIYVPLKSDDDYQNTASGSSEYSSGSTVIDFVDTATAICVYVSQNADSTNTGGNYAGDVLVGYDLVEFNNLSMGNKSINIGLDPENTELKYITSYNVWGTGDVADKQLRDIATCFGSVEATETNQLFGSDTGLFKYFKGMAQRILFDTTVPAQVTGLQAENNANIYFLETQDADGNISYAFKGIGVYDSGSSTEVYYGTDSINYLSFYHFRVNEEDNKVEVIETQTDDSGNRYDLNYHFYVKGVEASTLTLTGDTYDVNIGQCYLAYGDNIEDDKFAVGIATGGSSMDIIGNNLTYDSASYTEDNGHFGYYDTSDVNANPVAARDVEPKEPVMNSEEITGSEEVIASEETGESEEVNVSEETVESEEVIVSEETEENEEVTVSAGTAENEGVILQEELQGTSITEEVIERKEPQPSVSETVEAVLEEEKIEVIKEDAYLGEEEGKEEDTESSEDAQD